VLLCAAGLSTSQQAVIRRFAYETAHSAMLDVLHTAWQHPGSALHIRNLPLRLTEGPYLIKPYNLVHYAKALNYPISNRIVCDSAILSYRDPEMLMPAGRSELGSNGGENAGTKEIVIGSPARTRR
jgi:hypothetical protein